MPPDDSTCKEIDLVRREIKTDLTGLRELMNTRFKELGLRVNDIKESNETRHNDMNDRIDDHDTAINSLNSWKSWVSGSVRTIAYLAIVVGGLTGINALLQRSIMT